MARIDKGVIRYGVAKRCGIVHKVSNFELSSETRKCKGTYIVEY